MTDDNSLLPARAVREFFGNVSDMWVWRRLNEPGSTFPKPIIIARRRFWRRSEIVAWANVVAEAA